MVASRNGLTGRLLRLFGRTNEEPVAAPTSHDDDAARRRYENDERRHSENISWQERSYRAAVAIGIGSLVIGFLTLVATIGSGWIATRPANDSGPDASSNVSAVRGRSTSEQPTSTTPLADAGSPEARSNAATSSETQEIDTSGDSTASRSHQSQEFVDRHVVDFPAWYTPAPVEDLNTPPEFNVDNGEGVFHCEEWHSWFRSVPAAPTIGETYVVVKAPSSTAVVVTDIDIELHRYRRWKRQGTIIQCGYGGDIFTATTASFSFANNDSRVRIAGENGQGTLPPDQYRVLPGLAEVIGFAPDDRPGFYEWSMTIHAIIDQEEVVQQVGSEEAPLYSFVRPKADISEVLPAVDWDIAACEWVPADYSLVAPTGQRDWSCG